MLDLLVEIEKLVEELRQSENPDILHAITVLAHTEITFSPLLQGLISAVMEEFREDMQEWESDVESSLLQYDEMRRRGEQTEYRPENELWVLESNGLSSQLGMDGDLITTIYSLLEEAFRGRIIQN